MVSIRDTTVIDCGVFDSGQCDLGNIIAFFARNRDHKFIYKRIFSDEERLSINQPERRWELWTKRIWELVVAEYSEHIRNSSGGKEFVLVGSCPLSLFVNIGACIGRPVWFVNQFRGVLQYFDLSFKQNPHFLQPRPDISQLKIFETEMFTTDESIVTPTILIFLTTNRHYKLGDRDKQRISELLEEKNPILKIGAFCTIRPKSETPFILDGKETDNPTDLTEIREELYDINQRIRYEFPDMRGAVLAPAIPAVVALIYGAIWKTNLFGGLMIAERIGNEYDVLV